MPVAIYDTTLRDGTQREGISLSVSDKLRVTELLDNLGVAYIEGGWPGSNPKDAAYFEAVKRMSLKHAKIAAFGSTRRKNSDPATDPSICAMVDADTPVVTVVGKTSMLHVTDVLQTTPDENLNMIRDSLRYLKSLGKEVIYDAEHFFDGCKLDFEYGFDTLRAAVEGGADALVLCDTNGGTHALGDHALRHGGARSLPRHRDRHSHAQRQRTRGRQQPRRRLRRARRRCRGRSTATASAAATPTCAASSPTCS